MRNHYFTLGLSENASSYEIKGAFKRLAVKYHPDKHMGDRRMEEKFKSVNEAYQILSDPYKKAQFDLQLQYQHFASSRASNPSSSAQAYHYQSPKKRYGGHPLYGARQVNHKENNKATLYAFGMTFAIALAVMIAKGFYDLYLERKYESFLAERRESFYQAQELYDQNHIKNSLVMLADLVPFRIEEADIKQYREEILEDIMFQGEASYLDNNFQRAIRYYELVEQFSPYRPMVLKARLAQSYRHVDEPEKSLRMLKELIESNYQVVATLVQIAEVYDVELDDLKMSADYLELARDVAVNDYRARFGKGYMVVVTEEFLPLDHYFLYRNLADLYNRMEQPELSLGASNWIKRVWRDSTEAWLMAAKSYELMDESTNACMEYTQAMEMGYSGAFPLICTQ